MWRETLAEDELLPPSLADADDDEQPFDYTGQGKGLPLPDDIPDFALAWAYERGELDAVLARRAGRPLRTPLQRYAPTMTVVAVSVVLALAVLLVPGVRQAFVLATTHRPTAYTELFFDDVSALPTTYVGNKPTTLAFTIRNHELKAETYEYGVYVNGTLQGTTAKVAVPDGGQVNLKQTVTVRAGSGRVLVEVRLLTTKQAIRYRADEAK